MPDYSPSRSEELADRLVQEFLDLIEKKVAPNSAAMKSWEERVSQLSPAERAVVLEYTNLGKKFVLSACQTHTEMSLPEDPDRFSERLRELVEKKDLPNPEKLSEDGIG